ncbi:MAG: nuclear transport factor 2 family protein [Methanolinea sp.]|nr:nuclear transport factor 2 family protein [Methanolinea sp.]
MKPSPQTTLQVLDTIDLFLRHLHQGEMQEALSLLDANASVIGMAERGILRGLSGISQYLERNSARLRGIEFQDIQVDAVGTIAWAFGHFSIGPGSEGRVSVVLKGTGHAWAIVHIHLSYPVPPG